MRTLLLIVLVALLAGCGSDGYVDESAPLVKTVVFSAVSSVH